MGSFFTLSAGVNRVTPNSKVENWYRKVTGANLDKRDYTYIVGGMHGDVKALVFYFDYTEYSITMDICAPRALTRGLIKTMFDYPFNQLEVKKLFGFIDSRNRLSQKTFNRLGCREVARIPDFFGKGIDRLVYEATKEDVVKWVV